MKVYKHTVLNDVVLDVPGGFPAHFEGGVYLTDEEEQIQAIEKMKIFGTKVISITQEQGQEIQKRRPGRPRISSGAAATSVKE